ncbi:MAG: hypothetical protein D8M52_11185 [Chlorobi bacterium]|nr:hypothetical protein [Chlorobiota bacterium]
MLGNYKNLWCLTGRSEKWPEWYGMRFPPCYAGQENLSLDETGRQCYLKQQGARGITFYPTIRYKDLRVEPIAWNPDSNEPLLLCRDSWEPDRMTDERYVELMEELKAKGWKWDAREGGQGYLHVDDLTKIEGTPPEGAF